MKSSIVFAAICFVVLLNMGKSAHAQQTLWFGTVKMEDKIMQGRFQVFSDSLIRTIVYAPYGLSPTSFTEVKQQKNRLTFNWRNNQSTYNCILIKEDSITYKGSCNSKGKKPIELIIRHFSEEDAFLQGDSMHVSIKDIQILDRALSLLNNGTNWNRSDNRVCDINAYPFKWSLFCALHQASIDVDSEYRHLRPAIQAARQAINEITSGKKYEHLLQDYNNEVQSFEAIAKVLNRAKVIIIEKIKLNQ